MIIERHLEKEAAGHTIRLDIYPVGDDVLAVLSGGEIPHIGCAVMSVPRDSLTGDGSPSCTSSVLNVTGHKDELACRLVSEALCVRYGAVTLCTGGIHIDDIDHEGIEDILSCVKILAETCGPDDRSGEE